MDEQTIPNILVTKKQIHDISQYLARTVTVPTGSVVVALRGAESNVAAKLFVAMRVQFTAPSASTVEP